MGEQLTVEIEQSLKEVLLRYCAASNESPSAVIDRALKEFIAKTQNKKEETWFGLPADEYFLRSEEEREELWNQAYSEELDTLQLPEREVRPDALTLRQRDREALHRRLQKIRKKSPPHP